MSILASIHMNKYLVVYECLWFKFKYTYIFSSPEHEVLMVSYCGQWLSVVRRPSSVVRQHLMFTL